MLKSFWSNAGTSFWEYKRKAWIFLIDCNSRVLKIKVGSWDWEKAFEDGLLGWKNNAKIMVCLLRWQRLQILSLCLYTDMPPDVEINTSGQIFQIDSNSGNIFVQPNSCCSKSFRVGDTASDWFWPARLPGVWVSQYWLRFKFKLWQCPAWTVTAQRKLIPSFWRTQCC